MEVPPGGEFVIGRSRDCQLALEDPLVSRRHAVFRWSGDKLSIEDLGSRNGVKVNEQKIPKLTQLKTDDVVVIGGQSFTVVELDGVEARDVRKIAVTMTSEMGEATNPLALLGGVVEKAFAMGRVEDAERILTNLLGDLVVGYEAGKKESNTLTEATKFAMRLANETGKSQWLDWVFQANSALSRVPPAPVVDEIYVIARKIKYPVTAAFRAYLTKMRDQVPLLGPADRFAFQRIEGLVRVLLA